MSKEQDKEHAFDAYCKRLVKNQAADIIREYNRQNQNEVVFSDLSEEEKRQLYCVDVYAPDRRVFDLLGTEIEILEGELSLALSSLATEQRNIILLAYLFGLSDSEIALKLGMSRSTIQRHRTSTLEQLRKMMEGFDHE